MKLYNQEFKLNTYTHIIQFFYNQNYPILKNKLNSTMNRFTSKTFLNFSKLQKKTPFLSQRIQSQNQIKYLFNTAKTRIDFSQKFLSGKYYEVLGYPKETDLNALTDTQIKRQYLIMVKKYHSDGVLDPNQKLENQQITKCIISAFDRISSERIQVKIDKGTYENIYKDEDEIAMKIYGKKFNQIKYQLFKQGNHIKRSEFMKELLKVRKSSKFYSYGYEAAEKNNSNTERTRARDIKLDFKSSDDSVNGMIKILLPVAGVIGALIYNFQRKNRQKSQAEKVEKNKSRHTLSQQKIKQIQKRSIDLHDKKLSDIINSYADQQPPSLKYPSKQDPHQLEQLIEYSIAPDISLYEVDSKLMSQKINFEKLKQSKTIEEIKQKFGQKYRPYELTKLKLNSTLTLSIEAERCLQNIYIKVKDVADQIEQTGKYMPPNIFFRFFGYCMFQIRQKPLSLQNYRDTEYISLFDLFFDYYSPVPLKRHQYNEYVVGLNDDDLKMYGQVHLNHRKLPQRYISRYDKVVVMKDQIGIYDSQKKYEQIWQNFYRKYQKIWLRGYEGRITSHAQ